MKKRALLIGIDKYPDNALRNASNDASALADKLIELGFICSCYLNATQEEIHNYISTFRTNLDISDVGLFFFAGHGFQCDGENYLAATDTSFVDESSCKYSAVALNHIIDVLDKSKVNTKIIILDACRDNPFISPWRGTQSNGLAPVYAPKGTMIAYATSPGQKAADGYGDQGVYTGAILAHIATKKLTIENMFKRVRQTVSSQTNGQQITWEHTSLMGNFYFNPGYDDNEFFTAYSKTALADKEYIFEEDNEFYKIIHDLKSHNWHTQNPAINRIAKIDLSQFEIDELLILGRNIYQAACGNANAAVRWIGNIKANIDYLPESSAFHLLNGILFEIYFDSRGVLRNIFKTDYYETPLKLCANEKYNRSCLFIRSMLEQYSQRIVYLPGTSEVLCIDVIIKARSSDDMNYIDSIYIDGISSMYVEDETEPYNYRNGNQLMELTAEMIDDRICRLIAIPRNKVNITHSIDISDSDTLLCPDEFTLEWYRV